jgi:predicted site-specific integrase-resolvase
MATSQHRELEKLAYQINEAVRVSGLSRTTLYELMKAGRLKTVLVAGRRLVPAESLKTLLNQDGA